jgi:hypothetical protein
VIELAFQIPLMLALLFACVQMARVFYTYHTLQKALRGGAGLLARSVNVNYCDSQDGVLAEARNFIVYGNLQGQGFPVIQGLTSDMIQFVPERTSAGATGITQCVCTEDVESCDVASGGSPPDFIVVNLQNGFPVSLQFPFVNLGTINLRVSVRMPVTGA